MHLPKWGELHRTMKLAGREQDFAKHPPRPVRKMEASIRLIIGKFLRIFCRIASFAYLPKEYRSCEKLLRNSDSIGGVGGGQSHRQATRYFHERLVGKQNLRTQNSIDWEKFRKERRDGHDYG